MKRWFWIVAGPLWAMSGVCALLALVSAIEAPKTAAKNLRIKMALERRAAFVDSTLKATGELPSDAAFKASDGETWAFILYAQRPPLEHGFDFPPWSPDRRNYAIGLWRGEWMEFYDSSSATTSVDDRITAGFWYRDACWPLACSIVLAAPPFAFLILRKRKMAQVPPLLC